VEYDEIKRRGAKKIKRIGRWIKNRKGTGTKREVEMQKISRRRKRRKEEDEDDEKKEKRNRRN
jgi:hypothetical protein